MRFQTAGHPGLFRRLFLSVSVGKRLPLPAQGLLPGGLLPPGPGFGSGPGAPRSGQWPRRVCAPAFAAEPDGPPGASAPLGGGQCVLPAGPARPAGGAVSSPVRRRSRRRVKAWRLSSACWRTACSRWRRRFPLGPRSRRSCSRRSLSAYSRSVSWVQAARLAWAAAGRPGACGAAPLLVQLVHPEGNFQRPQLLPQGQEGLRLLGLGLQRTPLEVQLL